MCRSLLALLVLLGACTAADGGEPSPSSTPDGPLVCDGATPVIVYSKIGCDGSVKPTCQGHAGACGGTGEFVCGCDGKVAGADCSGRISVPHQYYFTSSPNPLQCKPFPGYDAGAH